MDICAATCGQTESDVWWKARVGRITASRFGRVMSAKSKDSLSNLCKQIKQGDGGSDWRPPACRMGLEEEANAKAAYLKYQRDVNGVIATIREVGLCVPNCCRSIGASPDGIVYTPLCLIPHILEIKCLFDKTPLPRSILQIAKDRGSRFYCSIDQAGELQLKKTHNYYYQVLGEMATTGLLTADFVIYHPRTEEIKVIRVLYDDDDWKQLRMKLDDFTCNYLNA